MRMHKLTFGGEPEAVQWLRDMLRRPHSGPTNSCSSSSQGGPQQTRSEEEGEEDGNAKVGGGASRSQGSEGDSESGVEEDSEEGEGQSGSEQLSGAGQLPRRSPRVDDTCLARLYALHTLWQYPKRLDRMLVLLTRRLLEQTPVWAAALACRLTEADVLRFAHMKHTPVRAEPDPSAPASSCWPQVSVWPSMGGRAWLVEAVVDRFGRGLTAHFNQVMHASRGYVQANSLGKQRAARHAELLEEMQQNQYARWEEGGWSVPAGWEETRGWRWSRWGLRRDGGPATRPAAAPVHSFDVANPECVGWWLCVEHVMPCSCPGSKATCANTALGHLPA